MSTTPSGKRVPQFPHSWSPGAAARAYEGAMTTSPHERKPQPCGRCSQPTRTFWLTQDGAFTPWCNFCVAAQIMGFVGSLRCQNFATVFARAIDSGEPEDLRSVSLALRGLATMLHDRPEELS